MDVPLLTLVEVELWTRGYVLRIESDELARVVPIPAAVDVATIERAREAVARVRPRTLRTRSLALALSRGTEYWLAYRGAVAYVTSADLASIGSGN